MRSNCIPKPRWLVKRINITDNFLRIEKELSEYKLHTVCQEALCPNRYDCWNAGHITIMLLGNKCTRRCLFCNIDKSEPPSWPNPEEPKRVVYILEKLKPSHVVLTSVTRDDLPDGGAKLWAETIIRIKEAFPNTTVEALIPDLAGSRKSLDIILDSYPHILAHNIETVKELYPHVRPAADYRRSLEILKHAGDRGFITKSSFMVGLGETKEQIQSLLHDLSVSGCQIVFIGQYLQPTSKHLPVKKYVSQEEFDCYREIAEKIGFDVIESSPFVRSSIYSTKQETFIKNKIMFNNQGRHKGFLQESMQIYKDPRKQL